jgi:hypothetical protein
MRYLEKIQSSVHDAGQMEDLYRQAVAARQEREFAEDLEQCYLQAPDEALLSAWHYRLSEASPAAKPAVTATQWRVALPISFALGLVYFLLTDERLLNSPVTEGWFPIWIGPIAALALIGYLALAGQKNWKWPVVVSSVLVALSAYATLFTLPLARASTGMMAATLSSQYLVLGALHCMAAAVLGVLWVATSRRIEPVGRFTVLIKAFEMIVTAGILSSLGSILLMLAVGLFGALGIEFNNEIYFRLAAGIAGGFIPVLSTAIIYDARLAPQMQDFSRGFSKIVAILLRLLLPISLVGLVIYIAVIPFYFWEPFKNRDVLIIYNIFLFAVLGMIVGATPMKQEGLGARQQKLLRLGLVSVAGLATLISIYALAAIVSRTVSAGFTPNRLTVLGWNIINIGLLILMLVRQLKTSSEQWLQALHRTVSDGIIIYSVWISVLLITIPLVFR